MAKLLARAQNWWKRPEPAGVIVLPFAIPCRCGQVVTGERKPTFQVVACSACQTELFVLPLSPLPDPGTLSGRRQAAEPRPILSPPVRPRRWWLAALVVLAILSVALAAGLPWFLGAIPQEAGPLTESLSPADIQAKVRFHQHKADAFIAEGHFCLALEHLDALADWQRRLESTGRKLLALAHHRREIALYADLLEEPLEEILDHAVSLPAKEWQAQFRKRYQGKAVIFDTELRKDGAGGIQAAYLLQAQGEIAQLNCADLPTLRQLPLEAPRRVLFGARLAKMQRIQPAMWTINCVPNSGVLLTNAQAAAVSCPALGSEQVQEILRWQKQRVSELVERP